MSSPGETVPTIHVLGVAAHMVQIPDVLSMMEQWVRARERCHWIAATGMHGLMEAHKDPEFKTILNSADLLVPDGISLVWLSRRRGYKLERRVSGPDLMQEFLELAEREGYRNYFYGDTEETLGALTKRLEEKLPLLQVVGAHSPPFRPLTPEEDEAEIRSINESGADVVWVGLGLPKQERWMFKHRDRLEAPVVVGVGAAFKFLSGRVKRAPSWVGDHGLEWAWRFLQEPQRVWRRLLFDGPRFGCYVALELSGLKKYE